MNAQLTTRNQADSLPPRTLDTRPVFAAGGTPCALIDEAIGDLAPGQTLVILTPFDPIPLQNKLGGLGFSCETRRLDEVTWQAEFRRDPLAGPISPGQIASCGCSGH